MAPVICTHCLHVDDRRVDHCPNCGSAALGKLNGGGFILELPGEAGMPCQACLAIGKRLRFRYFKYVIGMILADRVAGIVGYFCPECVRRQFWRNMLLTLTLGWWGIFALLFRNPFAIVTNIWGRFASPMGPGDYGAIHVNAIRQAARETENAESAHDVPEWLAGFSHEDLEIVMSPTDYYATLGVTSAADDGAIKKAWRGRVKRLHPDASGGALRPEDYEELMAVNAAYQVLRDDRLRTAYDRFRRELARQ